MTANQRPGTSISSLKRDESSELLEIVNRSIAAIHIHPISGVLGPLARKLHIAMGQISGKQYRAMPETDRIRIEVGLREYVASLRGKGAQSAPQILLQPRFSTSLRSLAEAIGYNADEARSLLPQMDKLVCTSIRFNSLRHASTITPEKEMFPWELEVTSSLLSSYVRTGRGIVSWAFDPVLLGIMVMPRTYAKLNLELLRQANTYPAIALYENCKRFVGCDSTGSFSIKQWARLLNPEGDLPEWKTKTQEFNRTLKSAIKLLDGLDACDITITPQRVVLASGEKGLTFHVAAKRQASLAFGGSAVIDTKLRDAYLDCGFSQDEFRNFMENHYSDYLWDKLKLMGRAKDVRNKRAWIQAAIAGDYQTEELNREQEAESRAKEVRELNQGKAQAKADREAYSIWKNKRLRAEYRKLPEDEQARWERRYSDQLSLTAPTITGHAAQQALFFAWIETQAHGLSLTEVDTDMLLFARLRPDLKAEQA